MGQMEACVPVAYYEAPINVISWKAQTVSIYGGSCLCKFRRVVFPDLPPRRITAVVEQHHRICGASGPTARLLKHQVPAKAVFKVN